MKKKTFGQLALNIRAVSIAYDQLFDDGLFWVLFWGIAHLEIAKSTTIGHVTDFLSFPCNKKYIRVFSIAYYQLFYDGWMECMSYFEVLDEAEAPSLDPLDIPYYS